MRIRLLLLISVFSLCFGVSVISQNNYHIEQITIKDGLLSNKVSAICRDYMGYLWIGTNEGVNKYDGEFMQSYQYGQGCGLKGNSISFIFEDEQNTLWVGTNGGIVLYDRFKDRFIEPENEILRKLFSCYCLIPECIVLGGSGEIVFFYYRTGIIKKIKRNVIDGPWYSEYKLAGIDQSTIAIASRNRLWKYHLDTNRMDLIDIDQIGRGISLLNDTEGNIWLSNTTKGVNVYNSEGRNITPQIIKKTFNSRNCCVTDIHEKEDQIWFSTDGHGIFIYDRINNKVENINYQQGVSNSLATSSILKLYTDKFNNVLVGSVRAGLIRINKVPVQFYSDVIPGSKYGLSHPTVLSIFEDNDGLIWIGTDGGGLNVFNPRYNTFEHIKEFNHSKVSSICAYKKGKLIISLYNKGVHVFNTKLKQFESDENYPWLNHVKSINSSVAVKFKHGHQGNIWVLGSHLQLLKDDEIIEDITVDNGWKGDLKRQLSSVKVINEDEVLLGGINGVYRINRKEKTSKQVVSLWRPKWGKSQRFRYVYSMSLVGDKVWIGSSIGLFSYDVLTGAVRQYKSDLYTSVLNVIDESDSSLLIISKNGLYRYFPLEEKYQILGRSEGINKHEFIGRSACKTNNGEIYIGVSDGMVRIHKINRPIIADQDVNVSFDRIIADGVAISKNNDSRLLLDQIILPWNNTSLQLSIVVNEKDFFRKRLFRYRIKGLSEEFVEVSNPQLTFLYLPSGNYQLEVYCNKTDGSWIEKATVLSIVVPLPWWKTWWFFSIISVVMLILFVLIRAYLLKQSELTVQLELERERKEDEKKSNEMKFQFFTNISHELRTPLSLIYGPLQRLSEEKDIARDKTYHHIQLMFKQAVKMKSLIDQVLDIRKMDAGKKEIVLSTITLNSWLAECIKQFELEIESKELQVVMSCDKVPDIDIDVDKLDKILSNILSNAIKYSPIGGTLFFDLKLDENNLLFSIGDEGPGIEPGEEKKIFERFFQAGGHKSGSGIGLAYVYHLIQLLGGKIWVKNREEGGALFEFTLPQNMLQINGVRKVHDKADIDLPSLNVNAGYSQLKEKLVLVVEDDNDLRSFIAEELSKTCKVIEARNGKEAWHLTLSKSPDIIVSDVMMPLLNGFQLCEKLKTDVAVSHIPILLLTAKTDGDSRLKGYKSGADAYLSKPFSIEMLCTRIENIFSNRAVQKELFKTGKDYALKSVTHSNPDEVFLKKVVEIINDNIEDPNFNVSQLNRELAMSRSALYTKIKAITGMGANDFIKQLKMNKAAALLEDFDLAIGEIAYKVGFEDQRYFSTVFKDLKNYTPSQYRQLNR
ncbi:MAG: response regulator [Carboxylicivirga sp.]|jgi:signal transduction histidine kinase/ligand-binding sensor domain-containing protein/AraC-like DNA-binding protein|nr:response regulator [Carboxylicivirga sp.]